MSVQLTSRQYDDAVAQNEALRQQLVEISDAMLAEIREWASADWLKKCELHGETSDARGLVLHVASRSRRVTHAVREQSGTQLATSPHHASTKPDQTGAQDLVRAVSAARDEALAAIKRLSDEDIQRLHESEIDGERDALMASCGLVGHWTFHLPLVRQIRSRRA
jgi:hypothetical protein